MQEQITSTSQTPEQATQARKGKTRTPSKGKGKPEQIKGKLAYVLMNRPAAGNGAGLLAAHTSAFLALSGLADGKPVPRATMLRAWGPTAVQYHVANCRIEQTEAGYILTDFGREFFALRETGIDKEARAMFLDLLSTGKTSRECPQSFKATKPI